MTEATHPLLLGFGGIEFQGRSAREIGSMQQSCLDYLQTLGLDLYVVVTRHHAQGDYRIRFRISEVFSREWAPRFDTTQLCAKLELDTIAKSGDLEREIVLAMLVGPVVFVYPSLDELRSAVRIRKNIVRNGRKTTLAFHTEEANRPEDYWSWSEESGFVVKPGKSLIAALEKATQPDTSRPLCAFSCARASEYVMLLGIAQELANCNPQLLDRLQRQWENKALVSTEFNEAFLQEYGSLSDPLPERYYVPGDRVWFRNPDEHSSNVPGYEGSWVIYLGNGLFTNFWKKDKPFNLLTKCIEMYHWRNAVFEDSDGQLQVNDNLVDELTYHSLQNRLELQDILSKMLRLREPPGVYREGGCIDATREHARWVRPATADLRFPQASDTPT